MTVLVINPDGRDCFYHVWSRVRSVDDSHIYFQDGAVCRKPLCAKVDILSVMDAPVDCDYYGFKNLIEPLLTEFAEEHDCIVGTNYIQFKNRECFNSLDLLTHI